MGSMFERKAKAQFLIVFGLPITAGFIAILMAQVTRWVDASSPFFWLGIAAMILGYILLVYTKWDQIKRGDFFLGVLQVDPERESFCMSVAIA